MGTATDRTIVVIEVEGPRMNVLQMLPDGSSKRNNKELSSEREAQAACENMAQQLISRGFVEQVARSSRPASSAQLGVPASKPAAPARNQQLRQRSLTNRMARMSLLTSKTSPWPPPRRSSRG